jgi:hypothetical protein
MGKDTERKGRIMAGQNHKAESEGALTAEGAAEYAETEITVTKSRTVTTGYYP